MKKLISLLAVVFITAPIIAQNQERLSVHFFDIPNNLESKFLKFNRSVLEVPISYEGRSYTEGKKIKTLDGFQYLFNTIKYRFLN